MERKIVAFIAAAIALIAVSPVDASPKVVVSIVPIHSLVSGVMEGVAEPQLLVPVGTSPHNYALKPSDARALQSADVIVWVGEHLENYLEKPLNALAGKARMIEVMDMAGITLLDVREGGAFDGHDHGDSKAKSSQTKKPATKSHSHNHKHKHAHADDEKDMHLWLDPDNARLVVAGVAAELAKIDPPNAARYAANAQKLESRLKDLDSGIAARIAAVRERPYIVFHDAYQYFERHFGTKVVGSITVSPDQAPGAKRVGELRARIQSAAAVCVFREPQFPAPIVDTLVAGTNVKVGTLDPEGANLTPGPDAYFLLMDRIADSLATCLKPDA